MNFDHFFLKISVNLANKLQSKYSFLHIFKTMVTEMILTFQLCPLIPFREFLIVLSMVQLLRIHHFPITISIEYT